MNKNSYTNKKILQQTIIHNTTMYPDATIRQYLNMKRTTKDKGCFIIFLLYCFGLVIMLGIGFFYGNYATLGLFTNNAVTDIANRITCQGDTPYVSSDYLSCIASCTNGNLYLSRVCILTNITQYYPEFSPEVTSLIQIYDLYYTFPMITYVTAGLLFGTALLFLILVYFSRIIYIFIVALFLMLLGFSFYLLKLVEVRANNLSIGTTSIFYQQQQRMRILAFVLLAFYLLIFPFVLFSPKKIKTSILIIAKLRDYFRAMFKMNLVTLLIIILTWGSLLLQVFLVLNFYSAGTISSQPQLSMFYTYGDINLSHPASLTFHFIGVYWFFATLISWHKYFTSSGICLWYFQQSQGVYPLRRALKRSLNHVGSAALDAILMPVQWILLLIYSICKIDPNQQQDQQDRQKCIINCLFSFRGFICKAYSNINRNSPSSAVLTNLNFFESCTMSHQIFTQNSHKFFNIGGTLTIFLTIFVCILWVLISFLIIYNQVYGISFPSPITSLNLPIFTILLISLVIGSLFSNIFTASVDCLLFCYLLERKNLIQNGREQEMINRQSLDLKIKSILDQRFYQINQNQKGKGKVYIYQEIDQNTLELNYVSRKE